MDKAVTQTTKNPGGLRDLANAIAVKARRNHPCLGWLDKEIEEALIEVRNEALEEADDVVDCVHAAMPCRCYMNTRNAIRALKTRAGNEAQVAYSKTLEEFFESYGATKKLMENLTYNMENYCDKMNEDDRQDLMRMNLIMIRQCLQNFGAE
jgi:hypothetical protein